MGLKQFFAKVYAKKAVNSILKWSSDPIHTQNKQFNILISSAKNTVFGKDHDFQNIKSYSDFKRKVPIRDYEDLKPYIERVKAGEKDILWKGKPIYLCKTSGTTSGSKYIPISKESISNHIDCARNALLSYIHLSDNTNFVDGKMIFLQGSPVLTDTNGIPTGRLSGIVAHHVPSYLLKNRLPSLKTNCIDDWETKVEEVVKETMNQNMTLISGIPPWVQNYFEQLLNKSGKTSLKELFPNFSLFVHGGVNFLPYKNTFKKLIGKEIDSIETYPASEGFIAFQNDYKKEGLLLVLNKGIFYEFIPADEFHNNNPTRISLADVKTDTNYVLILNTNAGLWGYNIGDTVKFISTNPYKLIVTGRIKHFISAFGEHVIGEEVESALREAQRTHSCEINEFHVAPFVSEKETESSYHEWFIEFSSMPNNIEKFTNAIDTHLQQKNSYYADLRQGNMLSELRISTVPQNGFNNYMKSQGKLGGQNKTPRLANDRKIADWFVSA